MDIRSRLKIRYFSLIELIAAMSIFILFLTVAFQFVSTTQNAISISGKRRGLTEDARIALDIIARDLQNSYYGNESGNYAQFWHWGQDENGTPLRPSAWGEYRNELIAFISNTPIPPEDCTSKLCEVKYQLYYAASHDSNEGWLIRSVTGDIDGAKWNFKDNLEAGYSSSASAFSADNASSQDYQKLIPHVVDLRFDCYDIDGDTIRADDNVTTSARDIPPGSFPYLVNITITLMDDESWMKWKELSGTAPYPDDSGAAKTFRENNQQTFVRAVHIGNRGQN
ncbi:MAG TPA: hypothetical protein DD381_10935 [Lentisphaeria bacterium]|nr:MAG: hypothetical protein A2X47_00665 [Lentisphaerae bacterium GWF2_38_69]HBM16842.1 hypothetical protein [Lentisphaeria bacterium]